MPIYPGTPIILFSFKPSVALRPAAWSRRSGGCALIGFLRDRSTVRSLQVEDEHRRLMMMTRTTRIAVAQSTMPPPPPTHVRAALLGVDGRSFYVE